VQTIGGNQGGVGKCSLCKGTLPRGPLKVKKKERELCHLSSRFKGKRQATCVPCLRRRGESWGKKLVGKHERENRAELDAY